MNKKLGVLGLFLLGFLAMGMVQATNIHNCTVLTGNGVTWNLTSDIVNSTNATCMIFNGNNAVLNCNGYTIDGVGTGGSKGIATYANSSNDTINGCGVSSDWATGVSIISNNNHIADSLISGEDCLVTTAVTNLTIDDTELTGCTGTGFIMIGLAGTNAFTNLEIDARTPAAIACVTGNACSFNMVDGTVYGTIAYAAVTTGTANLQDSYYNKSRVTNGNVVSGAVINYKWTTDIKVVDGKSGNAISGANVTYYTAADSFYGLTNAAGYVASHVVTAQKLVNSTKTYDYMPATLTASKTGTNYVAYSGTHTFDGSATDTISLYYPSTSTYFDVFIDNLFGILFGLLVLAVIIIFVAMYIKEMKQL